MRRKHKITEHHLVPTSQGGRDIPANISAIDDRLHVRIHILFNNLTPVGQIAFIHSINTKVMSDAFNQKIDKLLAPYVGRNEKYAYKNGILVHNMLNK